VIESNFLKYLNVQCFVTVQPSIIGGLSRLSAQLAMRRWEQGKLSM
jgi:hypothetical protein